MDTITKHAGTLIDTSKEVCLEVNAERTKYMLLSWHQNAEQDQKVKTANRIDSLKMSHSSDIWEQQEQIKI
jgi:hypothetical protein